MILVRGTLRDFGVAEPSVFDAKLQKAGWARTKREHSKEKKEATSQWSQEGSPKLPERGSWLVPSLL
jgi:hypothetical protein